jgi:hypothetical protein
MTTTVKPEVRMEENANEIYDLVMSHITSVLQECDLNGIAGIVYVKNPSIPQRLAILSDIVKTTEDILRMLEKLSNDHERFPTQVKMQDVASCFRWLQMLFQSVLAVDEESFEHSKKMLNGILNAFAPTKGA